MDFSLGYLFFQKPVDFTLRQPSQKGVSTVMKDENTKHKHLTIDDRIEIQECLDKGMTFKDVAKRIGKDPTTVSKEVKKHIIPSTNKYTNETLGPCPRLLRAPFICNGCPKRHYSSCHYVKQLYLAKQADQDYRSTLCESRTGIALNKEAFYETEKIISNGIEKGQHINHIIASNDLPYSRSSVYRHINRSYYAVGRIDLPRAVKFKPRKTGDPPFVPRAVKDGRSYEDYLLFLEEHPDLIPVEMDTVIGSGRKVILTLIFTNCAFMVGLLLENKSAAETASKIIALKRSLRNAGFSFGSVFPALVTDNGGEFAHVLDFELDPDGVKETFLFFCHPYHSWEKPHVEKNHTILRDICPKGSSFDVFSQNDVNLIFSHINAVKRESLLGKSPYELFVFFYGVNLAAALGITFVSPDDVIQSPRLLKKLK